MCARTHPATAIRRRLLFSACADHRSHFAGSEDRHTRLIALNLFKFRNSTFNHEGFFHPTATPTVPASMSRRVTQRCGLPRHDCRGPPSNAFDARKDTVNAKLKAPSDQRLVGPLRSRTYNQFGTEPMRAPIHTRAEVKAEVLEARTEHTLRPQAKRWTFRSRPTAPRVARLRCRSSVAPRHLNRRVRARAPCPRSQSPERETARAEILLRRKRRSP